MDMGKLSLALKMISEEYKLSESEKLILTRRMQADEIEFEKVWSIYNNKSSAFKGGVDSFKPLLKELLS